MTNRTFELSPLVGSLERLCQRLRVKLAITDHMPAPPVIFNHRISRGLRVGIVRIATIVRMAGIARTEYRDVRRGRHGRSGGRGGHARESGIDDICNRRRGSSSAGMSLAPWFTAGGGSVGGMEGSLRLGSDAACALMQSVFLRRSLLH